MNFGAAYRNGDPNLEIRETFTSYGERYSRYLATPVELATSEYRSPGELFSPVSPQLVTSSKRKVTQKEGRQLLALPFCPLFNGISNKV